MRQTAVFSFYLKKKKIEDDFITTEPPSLSTATSDEHVIPIPPGTLFCMYGYKSFRVNYSKLNLL